MPVDNRKVENFEEIYKKLVFHQVEKIRSHQTVLSNEIEKMGEYKDLPNIGITLNNKIIELQQQFENAGISIYSQKYEDYGPSKLNIVGTSFIGEAIIFDLLNYAIDGIKNLNDYINGKIELVNRKEAQGLEKTNPIKNFLAKVRKFFIPVKKEELSNDEKEKESIDSYLFDYRDTDNLLWEYNLKDNIIPSIVKTIIEKKYSAKTVPELLEESVIPDLQKLGLADLIPQLQQALIDEYKKDLPDLEIYKVKQENMNSYIPDFNKEESHKELSGNDTKDTREDTER